MPPSQEPGHDRMLGNSGRPSRTCHDNSSAAESSQARRVMTHRFTRILVPMNQPPDFRQITDPAAGSPQLELWGGMRRSLRGKGTGVSLPLTIFIKYPKLEK